MCGTVRDRYRHDSSTALIWFYGQAPTAHHLKPLSDVYKGDTGGAVLGGVKTAAIVFHDDLSAGIRVPRFYGDVKRSGIGVHTVLDCIFYNWLQCQRWQTKIDEGRIPIYDKHIVILRLFHGQLGAGVIQFREKGDGAVTGYGIEIPAKVIGKILSDLLGFSGIEPAKTVYAH